jgi:hypothetical protein
MAASVLLHFRRRRGINRFVNRRAALFLIALLASDRACALTIVGYSAAVNDRFASGYATAPVPNVNPLFLGAACDWSGVGWNPLNPDQNFAMISDEYFVFASHYPPGTTLAFFSPLLYAANPGDPAAAIVTYGVSPATWQMNDPDTGEPSDLSIGQLTTALDVAHGIATYPILDLGQLDYYIGLDLLVYGHGGGGSPRIGTNNIDGFTGYDLSGNSVDDSFGHLYSGSAGPAGEARLQSGDSGGPSFVAFQGRLAITGTHSATGTISGTFYSVDSFIPWYFDQMSTAGIEYAAVPEPGRLFLLSAGALLAGAARRRQPRAG